MRGRERGPRGGEGQAERPRVRTGGGGHVRARGSLCKGWSLQGSGQRGRRGRESQTPPFAPTTTSHIWGNQGREAQRGLKRSHRQHRGCLQTLHPFPLVKSCPFSRPLQTPLAAGGPTWPGHNEAQPGGSRSPDINCPVVSARCVPGQSARQGLHQPAPKPELKEVETPQPGAGNLGAGGGASLPFQSPTVCGYGHQRGWVRLKRGQGWRSRPRKAAPPRSVRVSKNSLTHRNRALIQAHPRVPQYLKQSPERPFLPTSSRRRRDVARAWAAWQSRAPTRGPARLGVTTSSPRLAVRCWSGGFSSLCSPPS